ncbi:nuclear transport factor 2 family protein [Streptomyces sp. NPDC058464]|uniref:nuclear transport factor 2 family protein n=1 Tax=Streptomyces sp. NPDC058464 TaxID=3346511 RepID=UPI00364C7722
MPRPPDPSVEADVVAAFRAQVRAMTDGDTDTLDDLLAEDFTLTHITGYVQSKADWLAQMRAGQFDYHSVEEKSVTVDINGDEARLVGRFITDATVYGTRANWRLQLTMGYVLQNDTWTAHRSLATTW